MADAELPGIYTAGGDLRIRAPGSASFNRVKDEVITSTEIEADNAEMAKNSAMYTKTVAKLVTSDGVISDSIATAKAAVDSVSALNDQVTSTQAAADQLVADVAESVVAEAQKLATALDKKQSTLIDNLNSKFTDLRATLKSNKLALDAKINKQVVAAEKVTADLEERAGDILNEIQAHEDCMVEGWVYDEAKGKCFEVEQSASKLLGKVWHRMFNNEDGRENGYIDNRYIQFDKELDDTYLRVVYFENFRVHGHQCHGKWHVMFCDTNGNGCAECNDPGQIGMWKYAHHQGNWWMNDHIHGSVTGMCRRTDNKQLNAGAYQIRIMVDSARYDVHTGASGGNHLMVDEVVKY
jgi:hypothetical protein